MRKAKRAKQPPQTTGVPTGKTVLPVPLDEETRQMLDLIAQLVARGHFERTAAADYFKDRLDRAPVAMQNIRQQQPDHTFLPSEVITQWGSLPEYLSNGQPRPLTARGRRLSIEALVRRLDPDADADTILRYLIDTRAVERVGRQFVLTSRIIKHRRAPAQPVRVKVVAA